jgi:hypothetical protein
MKYVFPNGKTIDLKKGQENIADRYGAKPAPKKEEPKK